MAHYNGPKARINRRFAVKPEKSAASEEVQQIVPIFESAGAVRALKNRPFPPGMARAHGRKSVYGQSLAEKQKIKYYFGISERQLRKLYSIAKRQKGNTADNLKVLCERRLDNVIRRAGLCKTRPQARQGVAHGHFLVNGVRTDVASFSVRPGDVITVSSAAKLREMYKMISDEAAKGVDLPWLSFDAENLTVTVTSLPMAEDFSLPVEMGLVVEFLAR
ncbi:MAG: 30S ribosomal protein S4 [Planctomycetia bacterium]|nr:30S ribosomal protein S4 [Planctomycetia bacterium]